VVGGRGCVTGRGGGCVEEFDGLSGYLMGGLSEEAESLISYVLRDQQPLQCPFLRRTWGAVWSAFVLIGGVVWVEVLAVLRAGSRDFLLLFFVTGEAAMDD
jgi:hypothetical protein